MRVTGHREWGRGAACPPHQVDDRWFGDDPRDRADDDDPQDAPRRRNGQRFDDQQPHHRGDHHPRQPHEHARSAKLAASERVAGRFGADIADDPDVRPGYAPAGWTGLVAHLHRHGVNNDELLASGLAVTASTGRLIDRFRDRAVFPIVHDQQVLGFVGRRHPDATDLDHAGPKYLNTAETLLFHKRAQLFVAGARHLDAGGIPVVVEGPADAIAVTRASEGRYVGVAPLGTNLTSEQATQLRGYGVDPIIATDADVAGHVAAQRDYWILTPQLLQPRYAALPDGSDPAELVASGSSPHLVDALEQARPLASVLIDERLANLPPVEAALAAAPVIAAQAVDAWEPAVQTVAERINVDADVIRSSVAAFIRAWNNDPARLADQQLGLTAHVRERLTVAANASRWLPESTLAWWRTPTGATLPPRCRTRMPAEWTCQTPSPWPSKTAP